MSVDISRVPSGKKNRRMRRLSKLGLFVFLPVKAVCRTRHGTPPTPRLKEVIPVEPVEPTGVLLSHSQLKRAAIAARTEDEQTPTPDTLLPSSADGWQETVPNNAELHVVGITVIRKLDGSCQRYYRVLVKPSVVKAKRRRAQNLLRDIERDNAKAAKRAVRALVALLRP